MPDFAARVASDVTRLVLCWRIVRRDGVVLGFTAHDHDLLIAGQRYRTASSFVPSALVRSAGTAVDSIDMRGALSHAAISEADLLSGRYDLAEIFMFMLDWQAPDAGRIDLGSGRFGHVSSDGHAFRVEVRGLTDSLDQAIVELTSPECRADFGDKRCRAALRRYTRIAQVTAVTDSMALEAEGLSSQTDAYAYGQLRWLTGANSGRDSEVTKSVVLLETSFDAARLRLLLREPPLYLMESGDRFRLTFGCDHRFVTCQGRFDNQLNFRGEPFVPGIDALLRYPDA